MSASRRSQLLVLLGGVATATAAAAAAGLPFGDTLVLVGLAGGVASLGWLIGRVAIRVRPHPVAVAVIPVVVVVVGALAAARAMFVSSHDLSALVVVVAAASTAGVLGALDLAAELRASHMRLEAMAERERAVERSRRELVAWVSHDLRTPLAGIRAMVEALHDGIVDEDGVPTYHQRLLDETDRLAGLVDDLFELSCIEAGALQLNVERVRLDDLVSDAVASAAVIAETKGVRVDRRVQGAPTEVSASARELTRVVRNLLDNAIRHTPPGGSVLVEVDRDADGRTELSVVDECGGIPAQEMDRVFDLAYRGDAARTPIAGGGGGGLGLAIARGFVEAHHGDIVVRNENGGCRFTVRLPVSPSDRRAASGS